MTETEIPADIMQAARAVLLSTDVWNFTDPDSESDKRDIQRIARALLAERRRHTVEAQPVPEGWKLVPVQSTREMQIAGRKAIEFLEELLDAHNSVVDARALAVWQEMLSAAPTPPSRAEVTGEMVEAALITWFKHDIAWDKGMAPWDAEKFHADMRAAITAALGAGKKEGE